MKLRKHRDTDTWLRQVARSYRELGLLAAVVTGVTVAIIAGFVLYPYAVAAWNLTRQFVDSIRNALGK